MAASDGGQSCLTCHELESSMAKRMAAMEPDELTRHMEAMSAGQEGGDPPLVQDWMVKDPRGCLDCHRLRIPRATRGADE
ncbi:MAG: hypothetical protein KC486_03620 [Myxococcales bacterium]|nr:hypothetical protein [Myxococcales bacterium]